MPLFSILKVDYAPVGLARHPVTDATIELFRVVFFERARIEARSAGDALVRAKLAGWPAPVISPAQGELQ